MCSVSMVTDWKITTWPNTYPNIFPSNPPSFPPIQVKDDNGEFKDHVYIINNVGVSKEEFENFKKDFLSFKELIIAALDYDKKNNEPHCEVEDKVAIVKRVAEQLGVEMDDVFPKE